MRVADIKESVYQQNPKDPNDPLVLISGFGTMRLTQLEADLVRSLDRFKKMASQGNWENVDYELNGVFQAKLNALRTAHDELQQTRRRGGIKSRGITKR